jgi:signal transduction histidine kinase
MFHSARIKLTFWYLLIIMTISLSFSILVYHAHMREVVRYNNMQHQRVMLQLEGRVPPLPRGQQHLLTQDDDIVEDAHSRTVLGLASFNGLILIISGIFGYVLAGRTLAPIQKMMDDQHQFVSDASHELRTPLTSLQAAMEVFQRTKKPTMKEAKDLVSESIQDVKGLERLVDSMLHLAHTPSEESIVFQKVDMQALLKRVTKKFKPVAKKKNIELAVDSTAVHVLGDDSALLQLCIILLDNAIKYGNKNGTIQVSLSSKRKSALLSVADDGIGIAKKDIPHIFDRFYRADSARSKQNGNGHGLGLAIARKIVEEHNGDIEVKSSKDKGTTFNISLPMSS